MFLSEIGPFPFLCIVFTIIGFLVVIVHTVFAIASNPRSSHPINIPTANRDNNRRLRRIINELKNLEEILNESKPKSFRLNRRGNIVKE